jgi:phosphoribosylformylglycinamidine synthase
MLKLDINLLWTVVDVLILYVLLRKFLFKPIQNVLDQLVANGQVATQYVDLEGEPTMDQRYNPNGSLLAIEGITSPDGRVFGKMGHSERSGEYLYKNVTGDKYQPIFEGGVDYFKV